MDMTPRRRIYTLDMPQVLLVDDDLAMCDLLGAYLEHARYRVIKAHDGRRALALAPEADVLILDLMLPKLDGCEVVRLLRQDALEPPILVLSARGGEEDRIHGLDLGADDYLAKPCSPREVVARVRALLRRSGARDELHYGELCIRPEQREVCRGGEAIVLTRLEFELLLILARHPGAVWSRERLLEKVWGPPFPEGARTVDVRIAALRRKLGDDSDAPRFIETVHGVGYRFKDG